MAARELNILTPRNGGNTTVTRTTSTPKGADSIDSVNDFTIRLASQPSLPRHSTRQLLSVHIVWLRSKSPSYPSSDLLLYVGFLCSSFYFCVYMFLSIVFSPSYLPTSGHAALRFLQSIPRSARIHAQLSPAAVIRTRSRGAGQLRRTCRGSRQSVVRIHSGK